MSHEGEVTVVVPAHDRERWIGAAVETALAQTRPAAKVLVIDDGSTDRTAEVARAAGATVVQQRNGGPGAARNTGLRLATTTWVAFLDSDDRWGPEHLATLLESAEGHVLVATSAVTTGGRRRGNPTAAPLPITADDVFWPDNKIVTSCALVHRRTALQVGGFPAIRLCEDLDLWIRLLEHGSGVVLPEVTATYSEHPGQISHQQEMRRLRRDLVAGYTDRPWFRSAMLRRLRASDAWDDARAERNARSTVRLLAACTTPAGVGAVITQLRWRGAIRRPAPAAGPS